MHALAILGGVAGCVVLAVLIAAYEAKKTIPASGTRNSIEGVARNPVWNIIISVPIVAAVLVIVVGAGWL